MKHLSQRHFSKVPLMCASVEDPGIDEIPRQIWIDKATTPDQERIEDYLVKIIKPQNTILHVGIGNSSLARKLCYKGVVVLGITIHEEELMHANALGICNYLVLLVNKYSVDMTSINRRFDFIVDNNPSTYACCLYHFCYMFVAYKRLLREGGAILTAEPGLGWVVKNGNPNWALRPDDWALIASTLNLSAAQVDDFVYSARL
jgi:hypothetical protein